MKTLPKAGLAISAAALALAACSSAGHAPVTGSAAANQLVCQHYLAQRDHVKHLVHPTVDDVYQLQSGIDLDAAQAAGKLQRDLLAMADAMAGGKSVLAPSKRVYYDCT